MREGASDKNRHHHGDRERSERDRHREKRRHEREEEEGHGPRSSSERAAAKAEVGDCLNYNSISSFTDHLFYLELLFSRMLLRPLAVRLPFGKMWETEKSQ